MQQYSRLKSSETLVRIRGIESGISKREVSVFGLALSCSELYPLVRKFRVELYRNGGGRHLLNTFLRIPWRWHNQWLLRQRINRHIASLNERAGKSLSYPRLFCRQNRPIPT